MSQVQVKSPFAEHCHEYIERDIPCLPVGPGTKVPGTCSFGEWRKMHGWDGYAERMPGETEIDIWCEWPGAGICVPMGGLSGLIAIDVDTNRPDIIAALEAELAGLMVAKRRGQRGYAAFVLAGKDFKLSQSKWNVDGQRVLDLLHTGRQVVMPPTVHPDTNNPYVWLTPFKAYDRDQLPECPQDIVERCQRAIEPFQNSDDKRSQHEALVRAEHKIVAGDAEGRQINDAALARLSSWLEDLIPADMRERSGWGYRLKPFWRGVVDGFKVGVTPQGIRDFAAERGITPVDLVMEVKAVSAHKAMDWLAPLVGVPREMVPDYDEIRKEFTGEYFNASAADVAAEIAQREIARSASNVRVDVVVDDGKTEMRAIAKMSAIASEGIPNELLKPPGVLSDILQWMLETAQQPLPEMSLHATLAFGSMVARQIYVGPTGVRPNLNLIGIARSGYGKGHPQACLRKLMFECQQMSVMGGTRLSSGQSIITRLCKASTGCAALYVLDEVDGVLRAALSDNAAPYIRDIADQFMTMYSSSGEASINTTDYANDDKNPTRELCYPHLTFLGFTTPDRFWGSVKAKDVSSGFVNRLLVAQAPEEGLNQDREDEERPVLPVPAHVVKWVEAVRGPEYMREGYGALGANPSNPVHVPYGDDRAKTVMRAFKVEVEEQRQKYRSEGAKIDEALVRWYENAHKLALIAAVAKHPGRPFIDLECAEWAVGYVRWCGRMVVAAVKDQVFESEFDEGVQKTRQFIMRKGENGVTHGRLLSDCQALKRQSESSSKQTIDRLLKMGAIEMREVTRTNGRKAQVWVAIDSSGEDE